MPALPAVLSAFPRSTSAPLVNHSGKCIHFVDATSLASSIWLTWFLWVPSVKFAFPHGSCQLCYVHTVLLELRAEFLLNRNFLEEGLRSQPFCFLGHQLTSYHVSANFLPRQTFPRGKVGHEGKFIIRLI